MARAVAHKSIDDVCDYVIWKLQTAGTYLNVLKLHKLLYYVQAWYLAFYDERCFAGTFQAWVHGPVNRYIYDRFKDEKHMFSRVTERDILKDFDPEALPKKVKRHVGRILESYGELLDTQLEEMTHQEKPWIIAREGYAPAERCEEVISDDDMARFYAARLKK